MNIETYEKELSKLDDLHQMIVTLQKKRETPVGASFGESMDEEISRLQAVAGDVLRATHDLALKDMQIDV